MSDSPDGKTYMGIAYNRKESTESDNYEDYQWSLIKGANGIQGPPGEDGQSLYTWVKLRHECNRSQYERRSRRKRHIWDLRTIKRRRRNQTIRQTTPGHSSRDRRAKKGIREFPDHPVRQAIFILSIPPIVTEIP